MIGWEKKEWNRLQREREIIDREREREKKGKIIFFYYLGGNFKRENVNSFL